VATATMPAAETKSRVLRIVISNPTESGGGRPNSSPAGAGDRRTVGIDATGKTGANIRALKR